MVNFIPGGHFPINYPSAQGRVRGEELSVILRGVVFVVLNKLEKHK